MDRKNGTSLSRSHKIASASDDGDRVLLDRSGFFVARKKNVGHEQVVQLGLCEGRNGGRSAMAFEFD